MTTPLDTMYPSLAAEQTKRGVIEYLTTTFALAEADAQAALEAFLLDEQGGIFRGPYLKIRTPYRSVAESWHNPLDWSPAGFHPYVHQGAAFRRLSTHDHQAEPTIVTTGTGSGKTEAFLLPILDHARRARAGGQAGIKAIILYPMNALVTDQAGRLARLLAEDSALSQVSAGVYIGGVGTHSTSTAEHLVDDRYALRENPPDILLTNYKMLDLLLLREADAPLWEASRASLQYLVLDEFHTYDGAQGTDVAMLLRRLGATLGVDQPERPLGRITPVATSATLGGTTRSEALRRFAETVFGTVFTPDSVIVEDRLDAGEVIADIDFEMPIPDIATVLAAPVPDANVPGSWQPLAQVFLGTVPADEFALAHRLRHSFLTRVVVDQLSGDPVSLRQAVSRITNAGVLQWGVHATTAPQEVGAALMRFLALLSAARTGTIDDPRPLVHIEVQLWTREVSRVLREVSDRPGFAWWSDGPGDIETRYLPAVYCRVCGKSGWQASAGELDDALIGVAERVWQAAVREPARSRVLIPADDHAQDKRTLDPDTLALGPAGGHGLPVLVTPNDTAAARERCPSCGTDSAIRFVGSAVSTLVSVGLTQLFGLDSVPASDKKTLVFTDSVQDAAHRAAFIEGRAFQFNLRSLIYAQLAGPRTLTDVAADLSSAADEDLYPITPPDFVHRLGLNDDYLAGNARVHTLLASRLQFQLQLEAGLRSRLGRTLELTGTAAVEYYADLARLAELARETYQNSAGAMLVPPPARAFEQWVLGLLDRLRIHGGILHPWLDSYIADDGRRWTIWGGSAPGMPKFPDSRPAPVFVTTAPRTAFDSLVGGADTWLNDWTQRCLGVSVSEARALLPAMFQMLSDQPVPLVRRRTSSSGAAVFGLDPDRLLLSRLPDSDLEAGLAQLHCPQCQHVQPSSPALTPVWDGSPCPRMHCTGHLRPRPVRTDTFYRSLYRAGRIRRIVAAEHTGLLTRALREDTEKRFERGTSAADPNVLACTPTLELGIDIGDLSSVALSSLPRTTASYLQRVGRAGRKGGNALILATVPSGPRDLYYFAEPLNLLAGQVVPPAAYLDASEILQRQYLAYCLDRLASGDLDLGIARPALLSEALGSSLAPGSWLRAFADAVSTQAPALADAFLALFAGHLSAHSQQRVRDYAQTGLALDLEQAAQRYAEQRDRLDQRLTQVSATLQKLKNQGALDDEEQRDLRRHRGEYKALRAAREQLTNSELLSGLVELSLLPNYNLLGDSATLDVALWWVNDDQGGIEASEHTFTRGSRTALHDFAPGAAFYAYGQKVVVDALDIGPFTDPSWGLRWLCPDCGWGGEQQPAVCPRCGSRAVADTGSRHKVLPLRAVSAEHNREDVVIDDDAEQRQQRHFSIVTTADMEPGSVSGAWRLKDRVFAAEYSQSVVIRSVNFGREDAGGAAARIGGTQVPASRFRTCTNCGVVDFGSGVRHRGWCLTRRGAAEEYVDLVLSHELHTQAVRLLLPVSVFNVATQLTSFKAALLLGLREDFGGDPQHLAIVEASIPDAQGRPRRFLVVHDTVPGGTGYLDRLGQPDRVRDILDAARAVLRDCPCQAQARQACHRCLLSVVAPREIAHSSRRVALEMLEDLLASWDPQAIPTVGAVDIATLHSNELEQRFAEALRRWVDDQPGASWKRAADELDFHLDGVRWLMRAQVSVTANGMATVPDFLLTRQDAQGQPVAVYLDGRAHHADPASNITADDAVKRRALREAGYRVWSITWADVDDFEAVLDRKQSRTASLVDTATRQRVEGAVGRDPGVCFGNPITMLTEYLKAPGAGFCEQVAQETAMVLLATSSGAPVTVAQAGLGQALMGLARGEAVADAGGTLMLRATAGRAGVPIVVFCEGPHEDRVRQTVSLFVLLDDSDSAVADDGHERRWREWLRWANLAQFLPEAQIWTAGSLGVFGQVFLPLGATQVVLEAGWDEVREFSAPSLAECVVALAAAGVPVPVPGDETGPEQWPIELSWPGARVAVVIDDDPQRDGWLREESWRVIRYGNGLDVDALVASVLDAIKEHA